MQVVAAIGEKGIQTVAPRNDEEKGTEMVAPGNDSETASNYDPDGNWTGEQIDLMASSFTGVFPYVGMTMI